MNAEVRVVEEGTIKDFAVLLLLALLACGCAPQDPNVLLITLDTTRVDALSCYGGPRAKTPRLDALARESLRFTQAVTTAPYTGPSHASMLTGLLPPQHGLRDFLRAALPEQAQTLAEILSDAGYDTAAFVSAYVLDAFEERGLLQDLAILTVSDHGELLGEHDRVPGTHSPMLVETTLRVPLLLRVPGRIEPGVEDRQVSVVDVFPTILELAGLPLPEGIAGLSLLRLADGQRPAYSETLYEHFPRLAEPGKELASVRIDGWKLLSGPDREELYDLNADPREERNVAAAHPERLAQLRAALEALRVGRPRDEWPPQLDLSEEDKREHIERLRGLGYIE